MCEALNRNRARLRLPVRVTAAILMLVYEPSVVVVSFAQTDRPGAREVGAAFTCSHTTPGQSVWPGDVAITTAPGDQAIENAMNVAIAPDGSGSLITAWEDNASADIHSKRMDSTGKLWTPEGPTECSAQSVTAQTSNLPILSANTPVILRLKKNLYKKDAKPGRPVEFEVGFDVLVNGQVFIQSGAAVTGSLRKVDQTGKGPAKVLIDLGPAQTTSGETVPLAPTRTGKRGDHFDPTFAFEFPPIIPVFLVGRLFEKKVLLDKDAESSWVGCWWCGVWVVAHVAENVALDPAKLKAAQAQYTTQQRAVEIELCRLLQSPNPDSSRYAGALFSFLSETKTQFRARLLEQAGDLDAATKEYQQAPAFGPAVCHEK